ncbi:30S ribosomal protein S1 [Patescibacteria group bacterium]
MTISDTKATPSGIDSMGELLKQTDVAMVPKVGDLVKGLVISVAKNEVHVDIDGLTTGVVRGRELIDESGDYSDLKVDDEITATLLEIENENGEMELSFRSAGHQKAWDALEELANSQKVIEVPITDANRGGLMAKVGRIEGFLPVSQLTPEHYPRVEGGDKNKILERLNSLIGQMFKVVIIDVNESQSKLIVSERAAWEDKQKDAISQFKVGDVVKGKITGVVDFGIFVEFGDGLEGLIHISELAWQRIDDPKLIYEVGNQVEASIISIDGTKISLSVKRLKEDPWKKAVERYQIGEKVKGQVIKLNPFGAFIELDKDIHGLAHISELSSKIINHPSEVLKEGQSYDFKILSIEPDNHRLGLSIKALHSKTDESKESTPPKSEKVDTKKDDKDESQNQVESSIKNDVK